MQILRMLCGRTEASSYFVLENGQENQPRRVIHHTITPPYGLALNARVCYLILMRSYFFSSVLHIFYSLLGWDECRFGCLFYGFPELSMLVILIAWGTSRRDRPYPPYPMTQRGTKLLNPKNLLLAYRYRVTLKKAQKHHEKSFRLMFPI